MLRIRFSMNDKERTIEESDILVGTVAMTNGIGMKKLVSVIHPYPTESEAVKNAAVSY